MPIDDWFDEGLFEIAEDFRRHGAAFAGQAREPKLATTRELRAFRDVFTATSQACFAAQRAIRQLDQATEKIAASELEERSEQIKGGLL